MAVLHPDNAGGDYTLQLSDANRNFGKAVMPTRPGAAAWRDAVELGLLRTLTSARSRA
jgi:hypothetical protein